MSDADVIIEGVTKQCVPLSQSGLNPDLRVNYEFGLVLGVDEFRQEQLYQLENDYLHNRSLHGYGTVWGLDVTLRGPESPEIVVSPGIGVDQIGRTFVIRHPLCASLAAWLGKQENPDTIDTIYVVARYDECLDALVPIAGQPCSSSEQNQAASRIRRSFQVALQTQPPMMEAWRAVRRLADVMTHVELVAELGEDDSDEAAIIELVRLLRSNQLATRLEELRTTAAAAGRTGWKFLRLPEQDSRRALDRIFTVWVTEVRPTLAPDLLDTDGEETTILLATLQRIQADEGEETESDDSVVGGWRVTDEGRPYLLNTQVIQSLLLLGGSAAQTGGKGIVREFVTVDTAIVPRGQRLMLRLWIHADETPNLGSGAVEVRRILPDQVEMLSMADPADETGADGNHLIWSLRQQGRGQPLADGQLLELRFNTDQIRIGSRTLTEVLHAEPYAYLGYDGAQTLTAYYIVDETAAVQTGGITEAEVRKIVEERFNAIRTVPFVTITATDMETTGMVFYELWFHPDLVYAEGKMPEVGLLENLNEETLRIYTEIDDQRLAPVDIRSLDRTRGNLYRVFVDARALRERFGPNADISLRYVRFVFLLDSDLKLETSEGGFSIMDYMREASIKFDGFFSRYTLPNGDEHPVIVSYARLPIEMERR